MDRDDDMLDAVEEGLANARVEAAAALDRAAALAELRDRCLPVARRLKRPLRVADLWAGDDPREVERNRAEVTALLDRIAPDREGAEA